MIRKGSSRNLDRMDGMKGPGWYCSNPSCYTCSFWLRRRRRDDCGMSSRIDTITVQRVELIDRVNFDRKLIFEDLLHLHLYILLLSLRVSKQV